MPRPAKRPPDLPIKVARCIRELELGRKHYKQADALMDSLEKELEPGQVIKLLTGKTVKFRDKLEGGKTTSNVGMNFRRYEFKDVIEA